MTDNAFLRRRRTSMKQCTNCQKILPLSSFRLDARYRMGRFGWCKKCEIEYKQKYKEKHKKKNYSYFTKWSKKKLLVGECRVCQSKRLPDHNFLCQEHYIRGVAYRRLGDGSKETYQILLNKLNQQQWKCPYTKEKLILGLNTHLDHKFPVTSFPHLQCDISNVEWVSKTANQMKGNMTKQQFIDTCELIISNRGC